MYRKTIEEDLNNNSSDIAESDANHNDVPDNNISYIGKADDLDNNDARFAKANDADELRISNNTECILQKLYINTRSDENLVNEEITVPPDFIALTRSQLQAYLDEYIEDMPLEEYLDGLISYEIISFDKDKLILRKTYGTDYRNDEFYVGVENGEIVVYYSDKKTVYEYTGISIDELNDEDRLQVSFGLSVSDEDELYALLESFSS